MVHFKQEQQSFGARLFKLFVIHLPSEFSSNYGVSFMYTTTTDAGSLFTVELCGLFNPSLKPSLRLALWRKMGSLTPTACHSTPFWTLYSLFFVEIYFKNFIRATFRYLWYSRLKNEKIAIFKYHRLNLIPVKYRGMHNYNVILLSNSTRRNPPKICKAPPLVSRAHHPTTATAPNFHEIQRL